MLHDLVWDVQSNLVDCKRRFRSNGLSANFEVALNITNVTSSPVDSFLNYSVGIRLETVDKSTLGAWGGRFDGIQPKP
jgi:hypothetical protein